MRWAVVVRLIGGGALVLGLVLAWWLCVGGQSPARAGRDLSTRDAAARDAAAQDTAARELGVRELGGRELGARELGARELGARELGARELGARDAAASQMAVLAGPTGTADAAELDAPVDRQRPSAPAPEAMARRAGPPLEQVEPEFFQRAPAE